MIGHMAQDIINLLSEIIASPFFPTAFQPRPVAGEFVPPMRKKGHINRRRIMRPMLEHMAVTGERMAKGRRPILLAARPQDQVMRAGECIDTIQLHKAQISNHCGKIGALARATRGL